jgi:hypothetical protein
VGLQLRTPVRMIALAQEAAAVDVSLAPDEAVRWELI